jgi:hypothetical protein
MMKVGDLVRNKYHDHPNGGIGVITDEEPQTNNFFQTGELGTYYRIYVFVHNKTISAHPSAWKVISESR